MKLIFGITVKFCMDIVYIIQVFKEINEMNKKVGLTLSDLFFELEFLTKNRT